MKFSLNQLQDEHIPWLIHNFHAIEAQYSYQPFEGMIEELGELEAAITPEEVKDACGDVMIYMSDFASCLHIKFHEFNPHDSCFFSSSELLCLLGSLAHAHLKMMQNIRGDASKHMGFIKSYLGSIISYLRAILSNITTETLEEVCEVVWSEVKKRDWKKFPLNGVSA